MSGFLLRYIQETGQRKDPLQQYQFVVEKGGLKWGHEDSHALPVFP